MEEARQRARQRLKALRDDVDKRIAQTPSDEISMTRYCIVISNMNKEAGVYAAFAALDDQLRAYKLYYTISVLVAERLRSHREYTRYKGTPELERLKTQAAKAMDAAKSLRDRLEQQLVETEIKMATARLTAAAPKTEAAAPNAVAAKPVLSTTPSINSLPSAFELPPPPPTALPASHVLEKPTRPSPPIPSSPSFSSSTSASTLPAYSSQISDPPLAPSLTPSFSSSSVSAPRSLEAMYAAALGVESLNHLPSVRDTYEALLQQPSQRQQFITDQKPSRVPPVPPPAAATPSTNNYTTLRSNLPSRPPPLPPGASGGLLIGDSTAGTLYRRTERLRQIILPMMAIDWFKSLAAENSGDNKETCGVLAGCIRDNVIYATHLVLPKQVGSSDACTVTDQGEMDLLNLQESKDLLTLGWIHTHPTQTAFLSSVDLHTSYPYQLMMPEALAIVCAIKHDTTGVFRLTSDGMRIIGTCTAKGFHPHNSSQELFETSPHVVVEPEGTCEILDLR